MLWSNFPPLFLPHLPSIPPPPLSPNFPTSSTSSSPPCYSLAPALLSSSLLSSRSFLSPSSLCSTLQIQTEMDSAYFLETLAGNFMDVVQYNEDNRGFEVRESSRMPNTTSKTS